MTGLELGLGVLLALALFAALLVPYLSATPRKSSPSRRRPAICAEFFRRLFQTHGHGTQPWPKLSHVFQTEPEHRK